MAQCFRDLINSWQEILSGWARSFQLCLSFSSGASSIFKVSSRSILGYYVYCMTSPSSFLLRRQVLEGKYWQMARVRNDLLPSDNLLLALGYLRDWWSAGPLCGASDAIATADEVSKLQFV
jgi:hypothetical protein